MPHRSEWTTDDTADDVRRRRIGCENHCLTDVETLHAHVDLLIIYLLNYLFINNLRLSNFFNDFLLIEIKHLFNDMGI